MPTSRSFSGNHSELSVTLLKHWEINKKKVHFSFHFYSFFLSFFCHICVLPHSAKLQFFRPARFAGIKTAFLGSKLHQACAKQCLRGKASSIDVCSVVKQQPRVKTDHRCTHNYTEKAKNVMVQSLYNLCSRFSIIRFHTVAFLQWMMVSHNLVWCHNTMVSLIIILWFWDVKHKKSINQKLNSFHHC